MPSEVMAFAARRGVAGMLLLAALLAGCARSAPPPSAAALATLPWDSVLARARGTTVVWRMWRGDPSVNRFIDDWVAPRLRARYGVTLQAVNGQGNELVDQLTVEREAGAATGTASLLWINGETFGALRARNLLAGPWSHVLPAAAAVDSASPIISRDFEQDPAGYESPWGTVQLALIYDSVRTPAPPRSVAELSAWIRAHPGRFTYDQSFAGVTFLKGLFYSLNGGVDVYRGGFDSTKYVAGRNTLFATLDSLEPFLWRRGTQYPTDVAALHRLFANGEIDFSMSNNQNEAVTKALQGVLPLTSRALVLRDGTIANAHFLGIPFNAPSAAGAMVVADFLLSPEAQLEKQRPTVWADGTVLSLSRLPVEWRARFDSVVNDPRLVPPDALRASARPEVSPRYHERLQDDWRRMIR
ncbi:MAG: ABC transporter substrate-binding protein [Gemmatimonadaceae bacterium]|nr:ABC transporter substrate-binding protein [Gemmatimonadaceae bacterium]